MTREEARKKIENMCGVMGVYFYSDATIECTLFEVPASTLRAIADILDQVGKEDGKAGEG